VAGNDPFGARLRGELATENVDTSRLRQTDEAATTLAFAWKDFRGDGHFWLLRGADTLLSPGDVAGAKIADLAALMVGSVSLAAQPSRSAIGVAVTQAQAASVPVIFDVNLRPTLWTQPDDALPVCEQIAGQSHLVKLSLDDALGLFGLGATPATAIERMLKLGPRCVVLTDGARGCWFACASASGISFVPSFEVDAIEPTGAGDAFSAALISRMMASMWADPSRDDIRYAAAAGALATTRRGAWDGLPNQSQLASFLKAHSS
ncbi:MAG: PfkB family carbohydrate kinase, partial [Chloroflexota bacterium]|nr:PfkB family carbohydrate kinase [Chloroflexota bacterium]